MRDWVRPRRVEGLESRRRVRIGPERKRSIENESMVENRKYGEGVPSEGLKGSDQSTGVGRQEKEVSRIVLTLVY